MNLEVVVHQPTTPVEFVKFWSARYSYRNPLLYENNICHPMTVDRVWDLYKWKNGTSEISAKKRQSIKSIYIPQIECAPRLETPHAGREYLDSLNGGGIWDIFWLHCLNPRIFPIFDQHTYRAMARIDRLSIPEIPPSRNAKINIYFDTYLKFLAGFEGSSHRALDKALFAYGRFLKSEFAAV